MKQEFDDALREVKAFSDARERASIDEWEKSRIVSDIEDGDLLRLHSLLSESVTFFIYIAKKLDCDLNTSTWIHNDTWELDKIVSGEILRRNLTKGVPNG